MKILIVSPYLPHPLCGHGGGVYLHKLIQHLSLKQEITLVSFCDEHELELVKDLAQLPFRIYPVRRAKGSQRKTLARVGLSLHRMLQLASSIVRWEPYYVSKYRNSRMTRLIRELTRKESFDVVQVEFTQMGPYRTAIQSGKTLLQEIDVSFRPAYRRFKHTRSPIRKGINYIEWCRWARYETKIAGAFDHLLSVTDQDRMLLEWLTKKHHISYLPLPTEADEHLPDYDSREALSLVFVGTFLHSPNVDAAIWLCEKIFPLVSKEFPEAKLYVIGPHPPAALSTIASRQPGIHILGFVEDVDSYLRRGSVFVAPLRFGGGVKTKILNALAHGIPVVTTKIGIEGIEGIDSNNILVAESPEKFADAVRSLFADSSRASALGLRGWELVKQKYSWGQAVSCLEDIYQRVLNP
ncbi:MAG: glycosyltransferase family 4 protein [Bacteroidota bacterium]|jgi:glycosyltransferase involved in cell wall biosynthesis